MHHSVALSISTQSFVKLTDYLREYGEDRDPSQIASLAIDAWLAVAKGEVVFAPSVRGYQWKSLFLPEGAEVRMKCGAMWTYANVVGDTLVYKGQAVTPSRFAGLVGGLGRNAWRDLWIRLPGTVQWKKAGFHRIDQGKPSNDSGRPFRLETPETASVAMAAGLKNALALIEKASTHRHGVMSRRTDVLPDD